MLRIASHVAARSFEKYRPPSLPSTTWLGSLGLIHRAWWSGWTPPPPPPPRRRERLAAVVGDVELHAEDVDPLVVVGVDADLAVVEGARHQVVELGPGLALVVGAEDAAGLDVELVAGRLPAGAAAAAVGL